MAKKEQPIVQTVVNITPYPLPEGDVFLVDYPFTDVERKAFMLTWSKMNQVQGTRRMVIAVPEGLILKPLQTSHLKHLRNGIDELLKERGVE